MYAEFLANITIHPPWSNSTLNDYGVTNDTFARTQALFDEIFPFFITQNGTAQPWWRIKVYAWARNQLHSFTDCPWLAPNNVTHYLERLAAAMTNVLRTHNSHHFEHGPAFSQITFIAVHLEWIAFPLALLLLSLIFLIATIIKTRTTAGTQQTGMWKTSAMPTLIYSLPKSVQDDILKSQRGDAMIKPSKKVRIRLMPTGGWRASGYTDTSCPTSAIPHGTAPPGWI